jgi:hypothetical protein
MTTLLWIMATMIIVGAVTWVIWIATIVVRGNNYHALVKQSVLAELGLKAMPYLENRSIVEQITDAFKKGMPASSTAAALVMLIQSEPDDEDSY